MWTLFTTALARGSSTTQVSIMNTSANFVITALLGLAIFGEALPPLWWLGASLLVAGNVIIGRKDETAAKPRSPEAEGEDGAVDGSVDGIPVGTQVDILPGIEAEELLEADVEEDKDKEDEDVVDLGEESFQDEL
jgi:hypothetical protein